MLRRVPVALVVACVLLALWLPVCSTASAYHASKHKLSEPVGPIRDELYERYAALVEPHGYPLEQHFVTTADGYILRMFRIPHASQAASTARSGHPNITTAAADRKLLPGRSAASNGRRAVSTQPQQAARLVVYLQHGLLDSSAAWVMNGPETALAFLLADSGYDVWMGNVRGNSFSRNHTHLSTASPAYWAFSWDHMVAHDLPALINYTLATTGAPTLLYTGHSQGTTILLAALSKHPELRAVIRAAALLAPVAMVQHISSVPLLTMALWQTDTWFSKVGWREFLPSWRVVAALEGEMCVRGPALCLNFLTAVCGYNPSNLDTSRLPLYLAFTPAGSSVQNMAHWSQMVRATRPWQLQAFDYGTRCTRASDGAPLACNQRAYGSAEPPLYNLSAITTPLALFGGGQDRLADPMDLEYLVEALPQGTIKELHMEASYEHLDFTWGHNARERIYLDVLRFLQGH